MDERLAQLETRIAQLEAERGVLLATARLAVVATSMGDDDLALSKRLLAIVLAEMAPPDGRLEQLGAPALAAYRRIIDGVRAELRRAQPGPAAENSPKT
jgi:hypothetical protein